MTNAQQVADIRRRLRRAWVPFFSRYGRLTQVQLETIPSILEGINVVVASPTASGKTEAVVAPVAERFLCEQWEGLAVLYIVPTRALANDTLARIEGPLGDMAITSVLKHGDNPRLPSREPPNCLVTTPESLDSLICRRPEVFADLKAVILDEIHLLDNTYRGDQLRLLLRRLRKHASDAAFSIHLLSATLSQPREVGKRYVADFEIVKVPGRRDIDYHILNSQQEVHRLARAQGWRKLLVFCNLRESVESVAAALAEWWHPYPVVAHHGSLDRRVRQEAEEVMKQADVAVCVSTSTLEVGIDIGDINLIVLAEVPWSVTSLLQRIGRGNRREGTVHVAAVATSDDEKSLLEAMFRTASTGELPVQQYEPDVSVAVQQIFSSLFQHPSGLPETGLVELLSPICTEHEARLIVGHLRSEGWLEWRTGHWFASTRVMDLGEKGLIHSNIPDGQRYKVVDVDSGREIGTIAGVFDRVFTLGQRTWQVVAVAGTIIRARRFHGQAPAPLFQRSRDTGAFHHLLPPELRG